MESGAQRIRLYLPYFQPRELVNQDPGARLEPGDVVDVGLLSGHARDVKIRVEHVEQRDGALHVYASFWLGTS